MLMRQDVEMLNQAMQGLGQSFTQKRMLDEQHSRDMARELIERRMLDNSDRRLTAEQGRQDVLAQGSVDAYLQSDDGQGVIRFHGPQQGLDKLIQAAAQKGRTLKPMAEPPQKQPFAVIKTSTPLGDLEFHAQDADQLGKITEQVQKMGGKSPNHTSSQYGPIAADKYAEGLEQRADELDQQGQSGNMPGLDAQVANAKVVQGLRDRAKKIRSGIGQREQQPTETVETETDPLTGQPKQKVIQRGPPGSVPRPAGTAAPASGAGAGKVRMISPKGVTGLVPFAQVQAAQAQGYKLAP